LEQFDEFFIDEQNNKKKKPDVELNLDKDGNQRKLPLEKNKFAKEVDDYSPTFDKIERESTDVKPVSDYLSNLRKYENKLNKFISKSKKHPDYVATYTVPNPNYDEELLHYRRVGGIGVNKPQKELVRPFTVEMATKQLEMVKIQINKAEAVSHNVEHHLANVQMENERLADFKRSKSIPHALANGILSTASSGYTVGLRQASESVQQTNQLIHNALKKNNFTSVNKVAQSLVDMQTQSELSQVHGMAIDNSQNDLSR